MPKYQVCGTVLFRFDMDIEAASEDAAERRVTDGVTIAELVDRAGMPTIRVDSVEQIKNRRKHA